MNEADTCRKHVVPSLQAAGWDDEPHSIAEQRTVTDGRIVPLGKGFLRRPPKRIDYILRYTRDFPLAVVEAKAIYKSAADGLQQAKDYALMLGLKFAYATNGPEIIEFDAISGVEGRVERYPTPAELWERYLAAAGLADPQIAARLLTPFNHEVGKGERYYQQLAVNRVVESILTGKRRVLVTMAERAWTVPVEELLGNNCNLDRKNPRAKEDITHLPPEQLVASILEKEQRIIEIMGRIRSSLGGTGS